MIKRRKILIRSLIVLVLTFAVFRVWASVSLNRMQDEIRAQGYPVTVEELIQYYNAPSTEKNGADILQLAFEALVPPEGELKDILPIAGDGVEPHRTADLDAEALEAIRDHTDANALARQYALESLEFDTFRFSFDYEADGLMHATHVRSLARELSLQSLLDAIDDKPSDAARNVVACFRLADSLAGEPFIVSQLVRVALRAIGFTALEQALNRCEFSAVDLEALQEYLIKVEPNEAFRKGWIGYRCGWGSLNDFPPTDNPVLSDDPGSRRFAADVFAYPLGLAHLDGLWYYGVFDELFEISALPIEKQLNAASALGPRVDRRRRTGSLAAHLLQAMPRSVETHVRDSTTIRVAIVALAASQYAAENGENPDSASSLTPRFIDTIPNDPYGKGPITYRKTPNGFVAYSWAENRVDDNGVESESFRNAVFEGDLTFTVERAD